MMRRRKLNAHFDPAPEHDSNFGLSMGDLMTALLMIFVLLLSATLLTLHDSVKRAEAAVNQATMAEARAKSTSQQMRSIAQTYSTLQADLYQDLKKTFEGDLQRWNAEIDPETISIRFKSPDVLFEQGKADVRQPFKLVLQDFFKRYIAVLRQSKYVDHIEEIRIEGHTSSEWTESANEDTSYFENMQLSQDRTRSVLQYTLSLMNEPTLRLWCREHITANGLSFSKRLKDTHGNEDKVASRRVEFRVRTDSEKQIQKILLVEHE